MSRGRLTSARRGVPARERAAEDARGEIPRQRTRTRSAPASPDSAAHEPSARQRSGRTNRAAEGLRNHLPLRMAAASGKVVEDQPRLVELSLFLAAESVRHQPIAEK